MLIPLGPNILPSILFSNIAKLCFSLNDRCHVIVILLWLYSPLLGLGHLFSFLIVYTVGRTPWTWEIPNYPNTQKEVKLYIYVILMFLHTRWENKKKNNLN
jgi:hypothetical protein